MSIDFSHPVIQSVLLFSLAALIPLLLVSATCFTRYVIVLSLLRTALGLQQTPPNIVIISMAMFMSFFTMTPLIGDIKQSAYDPYTRGEIIQEESIDIGLKTFSKFIYERVDDSDYDFIKNLTEESSQNFNIIGYDLTILIPAFMLSELKAAFQFAFIIFLPFILIDLIVASILMALGMIMLPPISISLPVKLLIFLLVDGWTLIVGSLIKGFGI
ncbi:EscR/YscR/HrcR family type III secretion system export apparatus protein [Vibrio sp. OCN044]|uniref:EscR/YscR/HrcR family type III secretion system export apparatus protein n=1 Tax=Vibrio tetraodonis subsp. pristinus TaxID=2695891 RepID=A0A6L8LXT0_9VIBR|nr:flagellar type III secretion system pore protein FliP [Vibrio tetraodonis]MYM60615.1 EscR/YscR/HrcR family type III secretion system export apparatus protein [Vibrio tetraodonis subsp. pristinus]